MYHFFSSEQIASVVPGTVVTIGIKKREGFPIWKDVIVASRRGKTFVAADGTRFTASNISLINGKMPPGAEVQVDSSTSLTNLALFLGAAYLTYKVVTG